MDSSELLPQRCPRQARTVGDEVLIRDEATGQVHFLNPTAALIWECCDGATSLDACAARLRQMFSVPESVDVEADIRRTVEDLHRRGLLEGGA